LQRAYLDNAADAARVAARASSRSSNGGFGLGGLARAAPAPAPDIPTPAGGRFVVRAEAALLGPAGSRGVSPWASSSRARCAGTGLERPMTPGLGARWRPRPRSAALRGPCAIRAHPAAGWDVT